MNSHIKRSTLGRGLLLSLPLILTLSACSGMVRDRSDDYRDAKMRRPLQLPPGVDRERFNNAFPVPGLERYQVLSGEFEVPRPDALRKDVTAGQVRIQKLGDESWILMNGAPGQVWPRLRGFLAVSEMPVAREQAMDGVIETDWLQPADGRPRERYRYRIEQGVQRGTAEIYVLHSDVRSAEQWPQESDNAEREQFMVRHLAQYLADAQAASSVSMVTQQNVGDSGKVFLANNDDFHFIRLMLEFDRAWASLGTALRKSGFNVRDWDRRSGRYWVEYEPNEEEKESGWFDKVFKREESRKAPRYVVDMQQQAHRHMIITIEGEDQKISKQLEEELLRLIKGYIN